MQATRLQVHTRNRKQKSQNPAQQKPDVENTEIPVAEKVLTEEKQEQQVKEVAVRQENNGAEIRKPEHRKYRKYHNYKEVSAEKQKNTGIFQGNPSNPLSRRIKKEKDKSYDSDN